MRTRTAFPSRRPACRVSLHSLLPGLLCLLAAATATSLASASPADSASSPTGTISGRVTGPDDQPVPFANVSVRGTNLGAFTNGDGRYVIRGVPPGKYVVYTSIIGYKEERRRGVKVNSGQVTTVDFRVTPRRVSSHALTPAPGRTPWSNLFS